MMTISSALNLFGSPSKGGAVVDKARPKTYRSAGSERQRRHGPVATHLSCRPFAASLIIRGSEPAAGLGGIIH